MRTPIGVIAIIYESRPNVTADAAALCVRSGNAVILRGGSECLASNLAIHAAVAKGLAAAGLPETCVQMVRTADRAAVGLILAGLDGAIDLIIPRGGKSLVARVQAEARAPVLGHLEGLNHVFLHASADLEKAVAIAVNAKMRRVSVCGAAETLLVDSADAQRLLPPVAEALREAGCELRGDARARALVPGMAEATEEDWTHRIPGADHQRRRGRRRRRRGGPHRRLRLGPHRRHRRRGRRRRRAVRGPGRLAPSC